MTPMRVFRTLILIGLCAVLLAGGAIAMLDWRRGTEQAELDRAWGARDVTPVADFGSVRDLEILPLITWRAGHEKLRTEAGVSYLVRAGEKTILVDLGFNADGADPSPLEANMKILGVDTTRIDAVFITHAHRDHVGGARFERERSFALPSMLGGRPRVFAPVPLQHAGHEVDLINAPRALLQGVASTGPISQRLFVGRVEEQALVVNVAGRGLVVLVGCGHQTVPKLLDQIARTFAQPIHAIVGDLHYPIPGGRLRIAGIDVQRRLASGDGVFAPITPEQMQGDLDLLAARAEIVALGGHDTSDEALGIFAAQLGPRFRSIAAGIPIKFSSIKASN